MQDIAELAIRNALLQVEELGAHPLLTDAVVALSNAGSIVTDWYERGQPGKSVVGTNRTYQAPAVYESDAFPVFLPQFRDARIEADLISNAVAKASNAGWEVVAVVPSITTERHYLVVCRRPLTPTVK